MIVSFLIFAVLLPHKNENKILLISFNIWSGVNRTENKKDTCGKIKDFIIVTLPFNDKFLEDHILVSTFILLSLSWKFNFTDSSLSYENQIPGF